MSLKISCMEQSNPDNWYSAFPTFYIQSLEVDSTSHEITITAYDLLYRASGINITQAFAELGIDENNATVGTYAIAVSDAIGTKGTVVRSDNKAPFALQYESGANFNGDESARECLDAIAEISQTIYYINNEDKLVFRFLNHGYEDLQITKEDYFTFKRGYGAPPLTGIIFATELGDNVSVGYESGYVYYVRNNPFWENREDIATLLNNAYGSIVGKSLTAYELEWRGNYLTEIGDGIYLPYDNNGITTFGVVYLLNDTIKYNGGFSQSSSFGGYENNDTEKVDSTPTTVGEAIKNTFAKVDKQNKEITLLASEIKGTQEAVATLQINTESITASIERIDKVEDDIVKNGELLAELTQSVSAKMSAEDVKLVVSTEIAAQGTTKVRTDTGFTFDETGLTVSKSDSELSTTISEDGMDIHLNNEEVLTANSQGVKAKDLHATTYLIVGNYSRFEDYKNGTQNRTGCFWIGG